MRPFSAITLSMVLSGSLYAAEQLRIVADAFSANEKGGKSVFEGHVQIQKGSDELNASKVEVFIDADRVPVKYVAEGDASFFITAEDNSTYRGRARKVVFLPLEQEYRFFGDVHLMQIDEHKQIDGEEVIVNIKEGTAAAKGAKKQPVIMIFELPSETKK